VAPDEERALLETDETNGKKPSMGRLLAMNSKEWYLLVIGIVASAVLGLTMPGFALALSSIIAVFFEPDPKIQEQKSDMWSLIFFGIGVASFIATLAQQASFGIMGAKLSRRIRILLFDALLRQEVGWYDRDENNSGALTGALGTDAAYVRGAVGDTFGLLAQVATPTRRSSSSLYNASPIFSSSYPVDPCRLRFLLLAAADDLFPKP
jgi:ATP-binding cassette subfamily B (MDR/TAP) protein 1